MGGGKRDADHLRPEEELAENEIIEDSSSPTSSVSEPSIDFSQKAPNLEEPADVAAFECPPCRTYHNLLRSYETSSESSDRKLQHAKNTIRRYKPGDWIEELGGMRAAYYKVPQTTTLLLIGSRGSGKSALVNKISAVFEDGEDFLDRAQVSHNVLGSEGTCFLQEYMILRNSESICVYDTRSLSPIPSDNFKILNRWMTQGVSNGEMVIRDSDDVITIKNIESMARQGWFNYCQRTVNFVIFVINGVSVLESMKCEDTHYRDILVETFNYPFLSFKDNKPAVVVTHGDELSLADRARVRIYLGELLGIPPAKQIFDIPDTRNSATELGIVDMLHYSIVHADRNLPFKRFYRQEVLKFLLRMMDSLMSIDDWILMLEVIIICVCITILLVRGFKQLLK